MGALLATTMLHLAEEKIPVEDWPPHILQSLADAPQKHPKIAGIVEICENATHYWKTYLEHRYGDPGGKGQVARLADLGVQRFMMIIPARWREAYEKRNHHLKSVSSTICMFDTLQSKVQ